MKHLSPTFTAVFAVAFLFSARQAHAQHVSVYDSNGKPRTTADRNAEEARNKNATRYVTPAATPESDVRVKTPYEQRQEAKQAIGSRYLEMDREAARKAEYEESKLPDALKYEGYDEKAFGFGLRRVRRKLTGKYGFIDWKGNLVIAAKFDNAGNFREDAAAVMLNGAWGYISNGNQPITAYKYDEAGNFEFGVAAVRIKGNWGYIDKKGVEIIPVRYPVKPILSYGLFSMAVDGKYGYIDTRGNVVVPYRYEQALDFEGGMARVKLDGKWGYINTTGVVIIPIKYTAVYDFYLDVAPVALNQKVGYINRSGQEIVPPVYDSFFGADDGIIKVQLNGTMFYFDRAGNRVNSKGAPFGSENVRKAVKGKGKLNRRKAGN